MVEGGGLARVATGRHVPPRALVVSTLALCIPVLATWTIPEWHEGPQGFLFMLPALIPPFLLSYFKGWSGASRALAAGMASLALVQVEIQLLDVPGPDPRWVVGMVAALVVVSVGAGAVTELLLRERESAMALALVDPLTRLPNRRQVLDSLERSWARARRGAPLSVVLFDLDHFKRINDRFGHPTGDRVLRAFADVLAERTRLMDVSGRIGGEEFLSVLMDCSSEGALLFTEAIRSRLAGLDLPTPVTVSAGIATLEPGMNSPDVLVAAADQALYRAKREGRDRVVVAESVSGEDGNAAGSTPPRALPLAASGLEDHSGLRVVVVDDEPAILRALRLTLEQDGCAVRDFLHAPDALDHLRTGAAVDLLVTDVMMPEMSGFALADLAAELRPTLPVLYVSGYPQSDAYWGGTPGTVRAFLQKPLDPEQLRHTLDHLLDGRDAEAEPRNPSKVPDLLDSAPNAGSSTTSVLPDRPEDARILLIDDNMATLRGLRLVLNRAGFTRVETTDDPREVLDRGAIGDVDLVVTDLHMPGVDGFQVIQRLVANRPESDFLPILVLTGDVDPTARRRALALGASDFLNKPFDEAEARARVRNLLKLRFFVRRLSDDRDRLEWLVRERTSELADAEIEMAHRLAVAAEYRDDMTGRHAARVGLLASHIATELGLSPREVDRIRRAAPLHDVGKIGVADAVLNKPGPLTDEELAAVRLHPRIGHAILGRARSPLLRMACDIALCHHERWDGSGYPDGVAGEEIPLAARITAVADTFDVISHRRPYKEARTIDEAFREIVLCSGTLFDPAVVTAFTRVRARTGDDGVRRMADPGGTRETSADGPTVPVVPS